MGGSTWSDAHLTAGEKIKIIKSTALLAILYGLQFSQTLNRSKGKLKAINNSIAKTCRLYSE